MGDMETWERELLVARIVSGEYRCKVNGEKLLIKPFSRESKYEASELFIRTLEECRINNLKMGEDLVQILIDKHIWKKEYQKQLDEIYKLQEEMKVKLFETYDQDNARFGITNAIEKNIIEINRLESIKNSLDYLSAESIALCTKNRFLISSS